MIIHLGHAIFCVECYISRVKHSTALLWNIKFLIWNITFLLWNITSLMWNITSLMWNITLSILKYEKKNASRLLYILQRYKLPKMGLLHKGHWFIFNDSFLRRNKTNYERIERNIYCLYTNRCTPNISYFFQNELLYIFSINSPF